MSELIRLAGFAVLGLLIYGVSTSDVQPDKTRFLIMIIVGLLMIAIGYLGDIVDAIQANTKAIVDKQDPPVAE